MEYTFSNKVKNVKPSAIREIFKYASNPNVISFSAGNPSNEAFPIKEIAEISKNILELEPINALQYSVTEGLPALRDFIKNYMFKEYNFGDIIITSGAQQAIDLTTKALCNEDDCIICEDPSFIGAMNSFRSYNVKLFGVPLENDGIDIDKLENALKTQPNVRFIYTIPNFQNPSGVTMSLKKRKAVYNLAKKYNVLILEDNPYGDLRFNGQEMPNIKSFDEDGLVIYLGSFSKVLSPGMRVGYAIAPNEVIQKMVVCKQGQDVHTNIWSQMVIYEFLKNYNFKEHINKLRGLYKTKAELAMSLISSSSSFIEYNKIDGGIFLWCTLPQNINMLDFCKQAAIKNVCVVPGNAFLVDPNSACRSFRINYSSPNNKQLIDGITILSNIAKDFM